jgi:hypothetical protein
MELDLVDRIDNVIGGIGKVARGATSALLIYIGCLIAIEGYASLGAEKVNATNLDRLVKEERARLNMPDDVSIEVTFVPKVANSQKLSDKSYAIRLSNDLSYRSTLKHELYHIADGHCDSLFEDNEIGHINIGHAIAKFLFCHEPQAALYEAFGLRL